MWFGNASNITITKDSLADIVIFNLQWLADRMSDIISYKYSWSKGIVPIKSLKMIWNQKGFENSVQEKVINILEKFEIIYCSYQKFENDSFDKKKSLDTMDHLLIPSLLPIKPPKRFLFFILFLFIYKIILVNTNMEFYQFQKKKEKIYSYIKERFILK